MVFVRCTAGTRPQSLESVDQRREVRLVERRQLEPKPRPGRRVGARGPAHRDVAAPITRQRDLQRPLPVRAEDGVAVESVVEALKLLSERTKELCTPR